MRTIRSNIIFQFCHSKKLQPLFLFASYPVGYPILKKLHSYTNKFYVCTHFSNPNHKFTNQVQAFCKQNNIPCYFPVKKEDSKDEKKKDWEQFAQIVKNLEVRPKLGIACAYGYLIPDNIVELFEKGMILAHPSLIPKYRGGSPIFHVIANGQKQSGASFMEISPKQFDHGNLLHQVRHPLGQKDSYQKVQKQLSQLMAQQLIYVVENLDKLRPGKKQSQMDVSSIPPHQLEARINKNKYLNVSSPAEQVYNYSRALIAPRVKFQDKDIIVFFDKVFLEDPSNQFAPGQLKLKGKYLFMKCKDKFIKLTGWQQLTKKPLSIHTFIQKFINKQKYNNDIFFK